MRWGAERRPAGALLEVRDGAFEGRGLAPVLEMKELREDGTFSGYGSVFGVLDSYGDKVAPGAFKASLAKHKANGTRPKLLWQHKQDQPIGFWEELREDNHGLFLQGKLLIQDDPVARRAYAHLKAGSIDGLSIGFMTVKADRDEKGATRTVREVDLWEVSVVTFPANGASRASEIRAEDEISALTTLKDCERYLREAGHPPSRSEAVAIVSRIKAIAQREAEAARQAEWSASILRRAASLTSS